MAFTITVGNYIINEEREVTHCPSYYAADHETLKLRPGKYPVRVLIEGQMLYTDGVDGKACPVPRWILVGVDSTRVSGRLYNGFGGVNYSSVEMPAGETVVYNLQFNVFTIKELIEKGHVEPLPGMEHICEQLGNNEYELAKSWTFDDVKRLAVEKHCEAVG